MDRVPAPLEAFCQAHYRRLAGTLTLYCGDRDVAEELAQETLAMVCRDWSKVSRLSSPEAWMYRVGMNLAHSYFRRRAAERRAKKRLENERISQPSSFDRPDLLDALDRLPHRQRTALLCRFYLGMQVKEIAEVMECPEGTVKTLLHRGIRGLGTKLDHVREKEVADGT